MSPSMEIGPEQRTARIRGGHVCGTTQDPDSLAEASRDRAHPGR